MSEIELSNVGKISFFFKVNAI